MIVGGGPLRLCDAAAGEVIRSFGEPRARAAFALSSDGRLIALGAADPPLQPWDAAAGKALREVEGRSRPPTALAFSPDGKVLAAGQAGKVVLSDAGTGKELGRIAFPAGFLLALAFTPDGKTLVGGDADGKVRVWDVDTRKERRLLDARQWICRAMALAPDGKTVAMGTVYNAVRLWDVAAGKELAALEGHDSNVSSLALSPDGRRLASGLGNGTVLLRDVPAKARAPALPAKELTAKDLDALGADLGAEGAAKAHAAVWALAAAPGPAVPFLKGRLRVVEEIDPKKLSKWLADLDADDFDVRDAAAYELFRLGAQAEPELRKALAAKPAAEVKRQIEAILKAMEGPPPADLLRALRAVQALEAAGTPEARKLLGALAKGATAAPQTVAAAAALERLTTRRAPE